MATTPSIFTILNCDCRRRLFGSEGNPFKKAFLMKFLRGVMDVYRHDDDDEDGMRVTSITRMVFPSRLLQSTDHHLLYLTESSTGLRELSLPLGRILNMKDFQGQSATGTGGRRCQLVQFYAIMTFLRIIVATGINCKQLEALELLGLVLTQQLSPEIANSLKD
ncbi:uncharacterized protein LOC114277970 [Camellia sinensis]|uniref:uncharacterized protein LOC114277970 n=1 Tax=Camellia sinensis TaxID=4442 RepID=UPI0010357E0C|nr:uncharacterized protein LOC114277970 [Camellia sinensis]